LDIAGLACASAPSVVLVRLQLVTKFDGPVIPDHADGLPALTVPSVDERVAAMRGQVVTKRDYVAISAAT